MCGRYFVADEAIREYDIETLNRLAGGGDVKPGMDAPVVYADGRSAMRWGFERAQGGLVINARVETMGEKPLFRGLADRQRCAMPASRYYEWRRADRQKFVVDFPVYGHFWLAGLYRVGARGNEFVVLTQPPVEAIRAIHDRMPLILPNEGTLQRWLGGDTPLFGDDRAVRVSAEGPEQLQMLF